VLDTWEFFILFSGNTRCTRLIAATNCASSGSKRRIMIASAGNEVLSDS